MPSPVFDPTQPFDSAPSQPAPQFNASQPYQDVSRETSAPQGAQSSWPELTDVARRNAGVAGASVVNAIPSTANVIGGTLEGLYDVARHPLDTANKVGQMAFGEGEHLANAALGGADRVIPTLNPWEQEAYQRANALNQYAKNRYGSWDAFKNTVANDPAGALLDATIPLTLGETALERVPGMLGRVGEISGDVGRVVNPVNVVAKGAGAVAKGVAPKLMASAAAPTIQALKAAARAAYDKVGASGLAIKGASLNDMIATLENDLNEKGFDPTQQTRTAAALNRLKSAAGQVAPPSPEDLQAVKDAAAAHGRAAAKVKQLQAAQKSGQRVQGALKQAVADQQQALEDYQSARAAIEPKTVSLKDLDILRRAAGNAERDAAPGSADAFMAGVIQDHIDNFVNGLGPEHVDGPLDDESVAALANARNYWARSKKAEIIQDAYDRAANRPQGQNESTALQTQFRQIANSKRLMSKFSPEEQDAILQVVRGGVAGKILRKAKMLVPLPSILPKAVPELVDLPAQILTRRSAARASELVRGAPVGAPSVATPLSRTMGAIGRGATALGNSGATQLAPYLYESGVPLMDHSDNIRTGDTQQGPQTAAIAPGNNGAYNSAINSLVGIAGGRTPY